MIVDEKTGERWPELTAPGPWSTQTAAVDAAAEAVAWIRARGEAYAQLRARVWTDRFGTSWWEWKGGARAQTRT